jgi:hypothetical protein
MRNAHISSSQNRDVQSQKGCRRVEIDLFEGELLVWCWTGGGERDQEERENGLGR